MQTDSQIIATIALTQLPEVGLRTASNIVEAFGSAELALNATEKEWLQHMNGNIAHIRQMRAGIPNAIKRAEKELLFIHDHGIETFYFQDNNYPFRLAECPDAPLLLFGKGNLNPNDKHCVSIVGTRSATDRGKELCRNLVLDLAEKVDNLTIISGLAYGIDVTAHKAALEAGIPTIIIPGHGLDRIYPAIHRQIAINSLTNGGILTEYLSQTSPDKQNFVARNRIIAGMADAVIVIESKEKGGSLITANMAIDYNRDVFAVPGRPSDSCSSGCNQLIKSQRAALIENADDLIQIMNWESKQALVIEPSLFEELDPEEEIIMKILRETDDSMHINQLVMECKMPYSQVTTNLLTLELQGLVKALPGGMYIAR